MMTDEMGFGFEGAYVEADNSEDGTEDLDGWVFAFSMIYYWY